MEIPDLRSLYLAELQEARSFEDQIAVAVVALGRKAADPDLMTALDDCLVKTEAHSEALARILGDHGAPPRAHEDQAMHALLAEARQWADSIDDPAVRDAAMIASLHRVQHYQIAVYGSLAGWAQQLGLAEHGDLLSILEDEQLTDAKLSELAIRSVNAKALA